MIVITSTLRGLWILKKIAKTTEINEITMITKIGLVTEFQRLRMLQR